MLSVRELLEAGAHFGHQTHRWNPKMKPFIYGSRNGIYIINLQKTAQLWAKGYKAIVDVVRGGQKILFVGTKPQAQDIIREEAERSAQYYVDRRWLGGMLTNFSTIKSRIDRLDELNKMKETDQYQKFVKKEAVQLEKLRMKLDKALAGIKTMHRVPGLLVVVDPKTEHIAVSEARKLQIPIVAITDTNCDPDGIDYVIPANDDAIKSLRLFLHAAAEACLEGQRALELRIQQETRHTTESEEPSAASGGASGSGSRFAITDQVSEEAERLAASPTE
ncbi:MAG TPA: 30S ribosomal protein S2 [Bdellovibrionota bacterium]|nr:30S ribosomal protein S2 [Bdellovibrionota bacterium]